MKKYLVKLLIGVLIGGGLVVSGTASGLFAILPFGSI